jgi:hypothetical protein
VTLRRLVATLAVCAAALWPASADACSCAGSGSPCDAAWRADVVFVGNVVSIEPSNAPADYRFGTRRIELAVVEAFRGLQLTQVTLFSGDGGGDCGYPFKMGESYVVYAYRSPAGHLSTNICTRTQPASTATEDLAYLRSLAAIPPGTSARLAGTVQLLEWPRPASGQLKPAAGVMVTATGEGRTLSARANARGEFEVTGLALGTYEIVATPPDGYDAVPRTVEIHDPRGCGTTPLFIRYDGRVTGRLVDARGAGIRGVPLDLVRRTDVDKPAGRSDRAQAWTGADGAFELRLVAPGEYLLGFNAVPGIDGQRVLPRAYYPGVVEPANAATIAVSAGERVRVRNFVVPESIQLVTVDGIVVDEAGRPVREAAIVLRDNTEGPNIIGPRFLTGEDGRFAFSLIEGGKYDVHVTRHLGADPRTRESQVSIVPFTASARTPRLTIVMKPNPYQSPRQSEPR